MKDQNGDVFWPALGINQIENIKENFDIKIVLDAYKNKIEDLLELQLNG